MPSSFFSKLQLQQWYINNQLSIYKIAKNISCDPKTVYYWLIKFGIQTRSRKIVPISKKTLIKLYNSGLSLKEIGIRFSCTSAAVFRKFKQFDISTRTSWDTNTIHNRYNFSGNAIEKAYLIGFRIGDLNVSQKSPDSSIIVKSNTTHLVQAELLKELFSNYGPVWMSQPKKSPNTFHFTTALNDSFRFLLPKHLIIPKWINTKKRFLSFFAGYTDAEGSIGIYDKRAKFRIGSYDKKILFQIHKHLLSLSIQNSFRLEARAGIYGDRKLNGDFYRVSIMNRFALQKCLTILTPYLKHKNRKNAAFEALNNVGLRV